MPVFGRRESEDVEPRKSGQKDKQRKNKNTVEHGYYERKAFQRLNLITRNSFI